MDDAQIIRDGTIVGFTFFITLILISLFFMPSYENYCQSSIYYNRIRPPADLPKNTHIECTGDGILTYIPWYALNENRTYSIEYETNLSSTQRNGTWAINDNGRAVVWCK